MDGKCRWAEERNLSLAEGQIKGFEKLKQSFDWFFLRGVKVLSAFMFSTENWKRDKKEVDYLMQLAGDRIKEDLDEMHKKDYKNSFQWSVRGITGRIA